MTFKVLSSSFISNLFPLLSYVCLGHIMFQHYLETIVPKNYLLFCFDINLIISSTWPNKIRGVIYYPTSQKVEEFTKNNTSKLEDTGIIRSLNINAIVSTNFGNGTNGTGKCLKVCLVTITTIVFHLLFATPPQSCPK